MREGTSSVAELGVRLGPLCLAHPVINASGTMDLFALAETLGPDILKRPPVAAYVPKTITLEPRLGNPPPRIIETASGLVNSIGLPNEGLQVFVERDLPRLLDLPCPFIISVGGSCRAEYVYLARALKEALDAACTPGGSGAGEEAADWTGRAGLELNISCPNVDSGGVAIGVDPDETRAVVMAVRKEWPGLIVVKLTPNVTDITVIGQAAVAGGADAIAAVNTYRALALDRHSLRPYLGNIAGGLSGPAIKPLALRLVYDLYEAVDVPIVGMGGVTGLVDLLEFISCGATVVAVGSSALREPLIAEYLAGELAEALEQRGLTLSGLRGLAHTKG